MKAPAGEVHETGPESAPRRSGPDNELVAKLKEKIRREKTTSPASGKNWSDYARDYIER